MEMAVCVCVGMAAATKLPHSQQNWSRELKATFECKLQQDLILFNYTYPCIITYLTILYPHPFKMKMPNFDFTLLWKEHNHENLFAINKLSNF